MNRFICIHGHFYQPPRENPWLEAIEVQDSAYPYHDWNERITAECYAANKTARILSGTGFITDIVNIYSKISFNFGPTLLSWMEEKAPDVYQGILDADLESMRNFSGHGSALAQAYNHMIMPLANSRDKFTQIFWGIKDFEYRFKRHPEGMWLPETAVDIETLDTMAERGILFTILAPHQAKRMRKLGEPNWKDVIGGHIDPTVPYVINLPSGRKMTLFFYDGPISRAVAFEGVLNRGEHLANRLLGGFLAHPSTPQLVHIATDGETYGHHHRYGEMALAYAIRYIEEHNLATITNYGEFLEKHPPQFEVEIIEKTSWSCAHGIERWRSDCGCRISHEVSSQAWRTPLRDALDELRNAAWPLYENKTRSLLKDPAMARNDYIDLILNRSAETTEQFLSRLEIKPLSQEEKIQVFKLMELQRNTLLMYTSCGWFFDDISRIEPTQILRYAGRVIELTRDLFEIDLEPQFLSILEKAQSNFPDQKNGRLIYDRHVRSSFVNLEKVAAHYALSSLFEPYEKEDSVYCYKVLREDYKLTPTGKARLAIGKLLITSKITTESKKLIFGVFHLGDHNLGGGTRLFEDDTNYKKMMTRLINTFEKAQWPDFFRDMQNIFTNDQYSPKALFTDEQRKILRLVLETTLDEIESSYRHIYEDHALLINYFSEMNIPVPKTLLSAAEFTLTSSIEQAIAENFPDVSRIKSLLDEAKRVKISLEPNAISYALRKAMQRLIKGLKKSPFELELLQVVHDLVELALSMPFHVELSKVQNVYFQMMLDHLSTVETNQTNTAAQQWLELFLSLGKKLNVEVGKYGSKQQP